jgi:hypothetical protein
MKTYYFQIEISTVDWDKTPAKSLKFESRSKAITFGNNLARLFKQKIRMTDNKQLYSGSYLHPELATEV